MLYYKIFSNSIFFSIRPYYLLNDIDDQNDDVDVDGVPISGQKLPILYIFENPKPAFSKPGPGLPSLPITYLMT